MKMPPEKLLRFGLVVSTVTIALTGRFSPLFAQDDITRIMLLGNSITTGYDGSSPVGGFRDDLDYMLTGAGAEYDLVGTLNDGQGFDADHEGHGGWTVDRMLTDIDSFLVQEDPQMVLIHLGTNDISANQSVASTVTEMNNLLSLIYGYDANMIILLSALIPRNDSAGPQKDSLTTELNTGYFDLVTNWEIGGYRIKYVDHNTAFRRDPNWQENYLFDHVHPTNEGYAVMAETYFDSLQSEDIFDVVPPAAITDLTVDFVSARSALLHWTATGDDSSTGTANRYDVRYLKNQVITESNFDVASQAVGEPSPLPSGSQEEFTAGGLDPDAIYYFAVKALDEASNPSPLSNVPSDTTIHYPTLLDNFERAQIGSDWSADPEFVLIDGELSNESLEERWDFMAVYLPATENERVAMRWGTNADSIGIGEGGLALMLDAQSPEANGYLIFRHRTGNYYSLWTIVNGVPNIRVSTSPISNLPAPRAGDLFEVAVSSDIHGHHFDCYYNGVYDTRVSDPFKLQGNGADLWAGSMLHGNRNNNLEDFYVSGPNANMAPGDFSLLIPVDGDTVETGIPLLDWEDSLDPNLFDTVRFTLYYGSSSTFDPESTVVVDSLLESRYTIPPMTILSLVRKNSSVGGYATTNDSGNPESPVRAVKGVPPARDSALGGRPTISSSLPDDVVIYWKVKAYDTGGLMTWSIQQDWSFTVYIPEPPLPFSLLSPDDGDTVGTLTPILNWEATSDPDPGDHLTYTVFIDTTPDFSGGIVIAGIEDNLYSTPPLNDSTLYYWKIWAVDGNELITESNETFRFFVLATTGIGNGGEDTQSGLPKVFALGQNYPNPFNPSTTITFDIPVGTPGDAGSPVRLQVYNLRGQLVRTLVDEVREPGRYVVHWDGRDDQGNRVGSGIYLYTIRTADFAATMKMVLLK